MLSNITLACSAGVRAVEEIRAPLSPAACKMSSSTCSEKFVTFSFLAFLPNVISTGMSRLPRSLRICVRRRIKTRIRAPQRSYNVCQHGKDITGRAWCQRRHAAPLKVGRARPTRFSLSRPIINRSFHYRARQLITMRPLRRGAERPLAARACAHEIYCEAEDNQHSRVQHFLLKVGAHQEDVDEAAQRGDGRDGVEPHLERARHLRASSAQDHDPDYLREELYEDAYDDEGRDNVGES